MQELANLSIFNTLVDSCCSRSVINVCDPFAGFVQITPLFNGAVEDAIKKRPDSKQACKVMRDYFGGSGSFATATFHVMDDFDTLPKQEQDKIRRYVGSKVLDKGLLTDLSGKGFRVAQCLRELNSVMKYMTPEQQQRIGGLTQEKRQQASGIKERHAKRYAKWKEKDHLVDLGKITPLKPNETGRVKYGLTTKEGLFQFALEYGKAIKFLNSLPDETKRQIKMCLANAGRIPQELGGYAHTIEKYDEYTQKYNVLDSRTQKQIREFINKM